MESLNYQAAGVNYDQLDAFKRACQQAAGTTRGALERFNYNEVAGIRGESAYLIETPSEYLAHVEEGLGTKNLVADAMLTRTGVSYYHGIGIDTVATIVNDLITCGALPVSVAMHAAVGDGDWFNHTQRAKDLAEGFAEGCKMAGAVWGGGETPALKGIVEPTAIVLAGSALGRIAPKQLRIMSDVQAGDAIIFLASSGVQTNGLTLCRHLADRLPEGFLTRLPSGKTYGEQLLAPSVIYVDFIAACQKAGLKLNYVAHVTGHGWRKLMRLEEPFVYRITDVRPPLPIFDFLMKHGPIDLREAYATFNMGIGFAAYVSPQQAERCVELAQLAGYDAWIAGHVEKQGARKAVEIPSLGLVYEGDSLKLR